MVIIIKKRYAFLKHPISILSFLMLIGSILVFWKFIFGDSLLVYQDVGGDLQCWAIPNYSALIEMVKNFNFSLFSFDYDLGASTIPQLQYFFDPFNFLAILIGTFSSINFLEKALVFLFILRIFISGYACYYFLSTFKFSNFGKIIACMLYAFNGFMVLWGQFYAFGYAMIFFPLILKSIDTNLLKKKGRITLALLVAWLILIWMYFGYMVLIVSAIYTLIRFFMLNNKMNFKLCLSELFPILVSVLIGLCISAVTLLPMMHILRDVSIRLESSTGFLEQFKDIINNLYPTEYYKSTFLRFFSNNFEGGGLNFTGYLNYYENIQVFFSVLFIIIFPQFLTNIFNKKTSLKFIIIKCCSLILCLCFILFPVFSYALNGFVAPFQRWSFLLMPFLALIIADTMNHIIQTKRINISLLFISTLISLFACAYGYSTNTDVYIRALAMLGSLVIVLVFFSLLVFCKTTDIRKSNLILMFMCSLLLVNVSADAFISVNYRHVQTKSGQNEIQENVLSETSAAVNYIKAIDNNFYRIDKMYSDFSLSSESLYYHYKSASFYNVYIAKSVSDFYTNIYPERIASSSTLNFFSMYPADINYSNLLGVRYILTKDADPHNHPYNNSFNPQLELVEQFGNIKVWKNVDVPSLASVYKNAIHVSEFSLLTPIQKKVAISNFVVLNDNYDIQNDKSILKNFIEQSSSYAEEILSNIVSIKNLEITKKDNGCLGAVKINGYDSNLTFNLEDSKILTKNNNGSLYLNLESSFNDKMQIFYDMGDGFNEAQSITLDIYSSKNNVIQIPITNKVSQIRIDFENIGNKFEFQDYYFVPSRYVEDNSLNKYNFSKPLKDTQISGSVSLSTDGILYFPIPYQDGWLITIDNVPVEIEQANYGFMAVGVTKGDHEIKIEYRHPYLLLGFVISILGIVLLLTYLILIKMRNKNTL